MGIEGERSKGDLLREIELLVAERDRLLATVESLQAELREHRQEARAERQQAQEERLHLQRLAGQSGLAADAVRVEAQKEREALRGEVAAFKLQVTDQLKEMALHKMRSERIVENIPVGIAYLDKDLVYRWVNPTFSHLVKLPFAEVINRPFGQVLPQAQEEVAAVLQDVIASGTPNHPVKLPFVHSVEGKDHVTHWDLLALPMLGDDNSVDGVLVAVEVTGRVEREKLQEMRIQQLVEMDRLKGDFINTVSHELRTPLSTIAGYAEFLEDNLSGKLTEDQRLYVTQIQEAETRISQIVDDLLDFARMEAGTFKLAFQDADLVAVLQDTMASLIPQGQRAKIETSLALPSEPLVVCADRKRILQVLVNLVGNAIKFTPPGGHVDVSLKECDDMARIEVLDTGIGIAPEDLPHVFEKFYQVDRSTTREYGGAGLGLAISKTLVELHGGRIGVDSSLGKGSTFWIELPLEVAGTDSGAEHPAAAEV